MQRQRAAAIVVLVGMALGWTALPAGASSENGRISFARYSQNWDGGQSWTVRPNGTDAQPLLADGRATHAAAFSPDGERIAVSVWVDGHRGLQIIDLDGNVIGTVVEDMRVVQTTWAPNGRRLAFVAGPRGDRLFVTRVDGTNLHQIARHVGVPRWSPDGEWILVDRGGFVEGDWENELRVLRPSGANHHTIIEDGYIGSWAPQGNRIAFYRFVGPPSDSEGELFIARADGERVRRLTHTPVLEEGAPVWSPDGAWLAFVGWTREDFLGDLYKINLETGRRVHLIETPNRDEWIPLDWQRRP